MTTSLSEELLVGLVGLALIPWIGWTVRRGLRQGALPIGRVYVRRDERRAAFNVLLGLYLAAAVLVAFICADLLLEIAS
jgi:hypothetical protein